ncbi:DNA mismatch repair protein Mlh1 [Hordeum vulgare]|nr:DNA mismatch repair protein Mlh1 [Hordeum vulgare]
MRTPSSRQPSQHSSSPHGSDRRADGSRGRRSHYRNEQPAISIRFREPFEEGGHSARPRTPPPRQERARSPAPSVWPELTARLGPRVPLSKNDACLRLDRLAQSTHLEEEEGPIGPACFGPRIREELFPTGLMLPRDTLKYNGFAKPEGWLINYTTTVGIARGKKRVAIRYVPLMLTGSTQTWLNSLPAGNVNALVNFEEAFVRNFTGTYKCPGRPRELAMCV